MISRRVFLKDGAFALVSLGFAPSFLARTAFAQGRSGRGKQLIAIFQRGAVDGLSVIVPVGEGGLHKARPSIAIGRPGTGETAAIDLDGSRFSLAQRSGSSGTRASSPSSTRVAGRGALALRRAGLWRQRRLASRAHRTAG